MSSESEDPGDRSDGNDGERRRASDRDGGGPGSPASRPPYVPTDATPGHPGETADSPEPGERTAQPSEDDQSRTPDEFDARGGLLVGAAAYLTGYLLVGLLWAIETDGSLSLPGEAGEELSISTHETVGWLFYNAHFVDVGFEFMGFGLWANLLSGSLSGSLVEMGRMMTQEFGESEGELAGFDGILATVPFPVWVAVPVVVLVAAGFLLARRADPDDPTEAATAGAAAVVGYFALTMVGAYLFTVSVGSEMFSIEVGPQLTWAAGLMGIVYPILFGGAGGALAAKVDERTDPAEDAGG